MSEIQILQAMCFSGISLPGAIPVTVNQQGLGVVHLHFQTPIGGVWIIETVTPVSADRVRYHHVVFGEWYVPRLIAKFILWGTIQQAERDVPVWNHKKYMRKPMIVKGDGPIAAYRRWSKQFYSDGKVYEELREYVKKEKQRERGGEGGEREKERKGEDEVRDWHARSCIHHEMGVITRSSVSA